MAAIPFSEGENVAKRTCRNAFQYKLHPIKVGQELELDQADVRVALAAGWIEPIEGEPGYVAPAELVKPSARGRRAAVAAD